MTRDNNLLTVAGSVSNNVTGVAINGQSAVIYHDLTYAVAGEVALASQVNQFTGVVSIGSVTLTNRLATELPVTVNLRFDASGNLLWDGLTPYTYDCASELAAATVTNGWKTTYAYDGFGRRVEIVESSGGVTNESRLVWTGMELCQAWDGSGDLRKQYFAEGMSMGGNSYYYTRDHLGSVREVVDGRGNLR